MQQVVTPNNLGTTIKPNAIVPNKYDVNLDNLTLVADPSGVVSVDVAEVVQAENGLAVVAEKVELGGLLTKDTLVDGEATGFDLNIRAVELTLNGQSKTTVDNTDDFRVNFNESVVFFSQNEGINRFELVQDGTGKLNANFADGTVGGSSATAVASLLAQNANKDVLEIPLTQFLNPTPADLISTDAGNDLVAGTDSKLFVDVPIKGVQIDGLTVTPDANGIVNLTDNDINSVIDSSTIDLTLVGNQVSAVVKLSANAGNLVTAEADGLNVSPSAVRSLLDVEVQDAFGVVLFYASSTNV